MDFMILLFGVPCATAHHWLVSRAICEIKICDFRWSQWHTGDWIAHTHVVLALPASVIHSYRSVGENRTSLFSNTAHHYCSNSWAKKKKNDSVSRDIRKCRVPFSGRNGSSELPIQKANEFFLSVDRSGIHTRTNTTAGIILSCCGRCYMGRAHCREFASICMCVWARCALTAAACDDRRAWTSEAKKEDIEMGVSERDGER